MVDQVLQSGTGGLSSHGATYHQIERLSISRHPGTTRATKESVRGAERPPLKARPECGSRIPGKELRYLSGSVYELFERGHRRCMQGAEGEGEAEGF